MQILKINKYKFVLLALFLNLIAILYVYQSVFELELQGDSWFYGWGHQVYYESNVFSPLSLKGMRTSLGGASLTFGLIQNHFGLSAITHYTISVIIKYLSVVAFFFLINKLTKNTLASFIASILLSMSFAGVQATHWVFNMYGYIGLIFITLSVLISLDLPTNYKFRRWLISFVLACIGVWYATMRTNGIILLILAWSVYKFIILRSKSSCINLVSWIVGFIVFIVIDKLLLGQMESDYSRYYIIGEGLRAFQTQLASSKYDFLLSSASNLGIIILPDITWSAFNLSKIFSFLGHSILRSVVVPSVLIFTVISWLLCSIITKSKKAGSWVTLKFIFIFALGLYWSGIVYFIYKLGPLNFPSWVTIVFTLFGGYFMIFCLFLVTVKDIPPNLKDLFLMSFLWSFVFLLLPLFMNGGPIFGTDHRYLVTTAPAVPMFMAGLVTLVFLYKNKFSKVLILLLVVIMIFNHGLQTKAFFDRKARVHNRQISSKIWGQFTRIVPNRPEYAKNPPALYFEAADNSLDQETLFETLFFGFNFLVDLRYGWNHNLVNALYNNGNYNDLLRDTKKTPKLLEEFYALRIENQSLVNITDKMKQKIAMDIQK